VSRRRLFRVFAGLALLALTGGVLAIGAHQIQADPKEEKILASVQQEGNTPI
jgi:hypothetical protein